MSNKISISEILKGCVPGRIQSVGLMQIIPLISDVVDERFSAYASPKNVRISTSTYGTLVFNNTTDQQVIVPSQTAYVVKEQAQDHALPHAAVLPKKQVVRYDTAMCIEQSQGGTIGEGAHEMLILPMPLREAAHQIRRQQSYSRLWPAIQKFNQDSDVVDSHGSAGHLEYFLTAYKDQLDKFMAEFEPVENQVGAIILIDGKVVGIERTPNVEYWLDVWRPLIRECYGSLAVLEAKAKGNNNPPKTRVPLRKANSISDLKNALKEASETEYNRVKDIVNRIVEMEMDKTQDSVEAGLKIEAIENENFVGQAVVDAKLVVYASLVARSTWRTHGDWFLAKKFNM